MKDKDEGWFYKHGEKSVCLKFIKDDNIQKSED